MNIHPRILCWLATASLSLAASISHAQTIPQGAEAVDLENFATLPNTSGQPARVNVLRSAPNGRIFVNDQRGVLYTLTVDGVAVTPYLNLASYVPLLQDNGERGFQSFAFHPDFLNAGTAGYGKFYTMASQSDTGTPATFTPGVAGAGHDHDEVLLEWTAADPAAENFVPANAAQPFREVLRIARPNSNHNAGYLSFNPTAGPGADRGNLYLGTGDSGGGGDPLGLAQTPGKVYGAVLRIDPLPPAANDPQRSVNGQYRIPADNPYKTNGALLPEKYLTGFRNPQRFTWDGANGRMFVADIGQNTVEEIDVAQAGANYGWNQREGSYVFNGNGSTGASVRGDGVATGYTYPIAEYLHYSSLGNAVTIGPVYRGDGIPALNGRLLFSDFVNGVPYSLDANNLSAGGSGAITELRLRFNGVERSFLNLIHQVNASATRADLRFGTDAANHVYFLDKQDGVIRRIVTPPVAPPVSETPVVSLTSTTATVSRRSGLKVPLTFTRTGDTSTTIAVPFTVSGSAVPGRDYKLLKGSRTIKAGKSMATVNIVPLAGGEAGKVKVSLQPGNGFTTEATASKIKVMITD